MKSADLARGIEDCTLPNPAFSHREHVQLTVYYLRTFGFPGAEAVMLRSLRRFAASLGHGQKFHHTMSSAWVRLVGAALEGERDAHSFEAFLENNPELADKTLPLRYFSREWLFGDEARKGWVEPDIQALPPCPPHPPVTAWD